MIKKMNLTDNMTYTKISLVDKRETDAGYSDSVFINYVTEP